MNSFAVKAVAFVALFALFIFIFKAFDDTAPEREEAYQQAYDNTQQRIEDARVPGELETGISAPRSDTSLANDWGGASESDDREWGTES